MSEPVKKIADQPAQKILPTVSAPLNKLQRKARKLKRDPKQFILDSKAYMGTRKAAYLAWAKFGSFALVLLASILVVAYYTVVAAPRYATSTQFVVKEAGSNEAALMGFAALGTTSSAMRDALIIKEYVESREMAVALDTAIALKKHYQSHEWDALSRLSGDASVEDYLEYYKNHITVRHDELSDIVHIEVQAFTPEYSLLLGQTLLEQSEQFINALGDKMAREQLAYAQKEVERLYSNMKSQQQLLVHFQNNNELYNPEQQGSAMLAAIGNLQGQIITAQGH